MNRKTKTPSVTAASPARQADLPPLDEGEAVEDAAVLDGEADLEADDDAPLPDLDLDPQSAAPTGPLAQGREAIVRAVRHAPAGAGVYRMLNAQNEVLYVGKAKSLRKRLASYTRANGLVLRIQRMVAATVQVEIISTASETEALLLEANLIKQLRPRYNVLLRDDKSFPYILITGDHWAPQLIKHRGAQARPGRYFGPFASGTAVNRTITVLQRAFLIRTCTDAFFESRTRPCLLYQIKRCGGPCTQEVDFSAYARLVDEATAFLSGRSRAVKEGLAGEMEKASAELDFETAAVYRDRLSALAMVQAQQGINPRGVEEADVFAIHQEGGYFCIEVFFFRIGQNWGNRAYYPRADHTMMPGDVLGPFLAQFYAGKPVPRLILLSEHIDERGLLEEALSAKVGAKVEIVTPQRGEKRELVNHALVNAREALARKLAETASQARLLEAMTEKLELPRVPRRIEVYDNSHIQGSNAVGAMIVAGREGFAKAQYRKFNMRDDKLNPGDDYAMMREMLERRFRSYVAPDASPAPPPAVQGAAGDTGAEHDIAPDSMSDITPDMPPWPDLVIIDGGRGQLAVAQDVLSKAGASEITILAVAKGEERNAGRETLFMPGKAAIKLGPRDPVLYLIQRLRDEAHRFVIGSHRTRRAKSLREGGLQDIPGVGPTRKRALLLHFGTLKAIELASLADLAQVPGISSDIARRIFDFFHPETA